MKKIRLSAIILLAALLLCGCSLGASVDNLMALPMLAPRRRK